MEDTPTTGIFVTLEQVQAVFAPILTSTVTHLEEQGISYNNKVYFIKCENNSELVLRVGGKHWKYYKTESEVATLSYIKKNTTIPVPNIIHYSSRSDALGHEYILMEKMTGENLSTNWTQFTTEQKRLVLDQIAHITKQLMDLTFPQLGSLYLTSCQLASPTCQIDTCQPEFVIGVSSRFNLGPFPSFSEFIQSTIEDALQKVEKNPTLYGQLATLAPTVRAYISNYIKSAENRDRLNGAKISLVHGDYDLRNFLVDDRGTITALLDWEFAATCTMEEEWTESYSFLKEDDSLKLYFTEKLKQIGGTVPSDISGFSERSRLTLLRERVCPWWLTNYHADQREQIDKDINEAVKDVKRLITDQ